MGAARPTGSSAARVDHSTGSFILLGIYWETGDFDSDTFNDDIIVFGGVSPDTLLNTDRPTSPTS